jgi:hypothetical protein
MLLWEGDLPQPTKSSKAVTSDAQLKNKAEQTARAIKNAVKMIRQIAISTREAVKAFNESGALM